MLNDYEEALEFLIRADRDEYPTLVKKHFKVIEEAIVKAQKYDEINAIFIKNNPSINENMNAANYQEELRKLKRRTKTQLINAIKSYDLYSDIPDGRLFSKTHEELEAMLMKARKRQ